MLADLLQRGLQVALPLAGDCRYDLILDKGGTLLRVQCKTSASKQGVLHVKCRSTSSWGSKTHNTHRYTAGDIDLLAAVDLVTKRVYYIPATELGEGRCGMNLRLEAPMNGQATGIRWAKDYLEP